MEPTRPPKTARPLRRRRRTRIAVAGVALLAAGAISASLVLPATATPDHPRSSATPVLANLFEWNWPSVANECTTQLGPAGYAGVQVAPPQDSTKRTATGNGADVLHPWWEVYQPTDYTLTSRMGTESQFKAMVRTCRKAGVKVYVDAVINHMTGQGTTSYGGTTFTKYSYPGIYGPSDFHSSPADCPVSPAAGSSDQNGSIRDFNDYTQVFDCELVGLSDLNTSTPKVRATIAAYLNRLLSYGVSGFRVDAAKHIGQTDLAAIESRLHRTVDGTRPTFALEVGAGSPGRLSAAAFTGQGQVLGFDYASALQSAFKSYDANDGLPRNDGNIGTLKVFGEASGLLPSADELVFVQNHDTERNGSTLNYKDPDNLIATQFMLAYPYGTPQVYSGFTFGDDTNQSPPSTSAGLITDTDCSSSAWNCTDRQLGVKGMVGFHNRVGQAPVRNWYDDGKNLVAFSRGDLGFFATNNETAARTITVRTGLPGGTYCDVIHGVRHGGSCSGPTIHVRGDGTARVTVGSYDSVAFTRSDRV